MSETPPTNDSRPECFVFKETRRPEGIRAWGLLIYFMSNRLTDYAFKTVLSVGWTLAVAVLATSIWALGKLEPDEYRGRIQ